MPPFKDVLADYPGKTVVDLVRQWRAVDYDGIYEGISWGNINTNAGQSMKTEKDMKGTEY